MFNDLGCFLNCLEHSGLSKDAKIQIKPFGAQGQVRKSRNHGHEGFEGSHICKSKSYKFKLKQDNTTELLSISFA